ncbi:MAG: aminotransferase class III-fold pyridoxal phosphate-dependent enzyme [Acidimicrobiales bacterium]
MDAHAERLAAVVLEPLVQGAAGMQVTTPEAVRRVVEAAQAAGVLVIADEVATGFGRTGTLFASEQCGIRPDLMVIGKGITGGYLPLSATVAAGPVHRSFLGPDLSERTFYHGHSYSGNALACAVALRHLALVDEWDVLTNVRARRAAGRAAGGGHRPAHRRGRRAPPRVDDRRGAGAAHRRAPLGSSRLRRHRRCGVLLRPLGDVVVLMPPLTTTADEIDRIVDTLAAALDEVSS